MLQSCTYIFHVLHFPPNMPRVFPPLDRHLDCFPLQQPLLSIWSSFSIYACFPSFIMLSLFSHCSKLLQYDYLYYIIFHFTVFYFSPFSFKTAIHCPTLSGGILSVFPNLESHRNSFCILLGTHRIAEHRVGASHTLDSSLLLFQELVHLASHLTLS